MASRTKCLISELEDAFIVYEAFVCLKNGLFMIDGIQFDISG